MKRCLKTILLVMCYLLVLTGCAGDRGSSSSVANSSTESVNKDVLSSATSADVSSAAESSADVSSAISSSSPLSSVVSRPSSEAPFVKPGDTITIDGATYTRTFYDDFDGTSLDKSKWQLCPEYKRQDVGGYWDDDCTSLDGNGNLVLTAKMDGTTPKSGAIRTRGKFSQVQGYFEMRCKVQSAPGYWGAFWLLSDSMSYPWTTGNGAKNGVEIDIMESNNVYSKSINNAIHWDGYNSDHKKLAKTLNNTNCYDGKYHTYSLLWTDTAYIFYIDGKETYRTQSDYGNWPGSCEDPCYIKVTAEFGTWAGSIVESKLPDKFVVDYVMAYKKA